MNHQSESLNSEEVGREFGVKRHAVNKWIRLGYLKATRFGRWCYMIDRSEVERFRAELVERRASRGVRIPVNQDPIAENFYAKERESLRPDKA
jgi:predicted site-specific integrase-resolvase